MVDEYQDTNRQQYRLVRHLTSTHANVCVVGDEDQSIYSWRGADIQNILSFEKDYPSVRVIRLEQNYRSTKTILAAASAVVANNEMRKGKSLWTQNPPGERITYMEASDADEEAMFVAERILGYQKSRPDARIAVLYRTNFLSRVLEEKLRRYNMKYRIAGGFSFYERAEIKDMIRYLTIALNPQDSVHVAARDQFAGARNRQNHNGYASGHCRRAGNVGLGRHRDCHRGAAVSDADDSCAGKFLSDGRRRLFRRRRSSPTRSCWKRS